MSSIGSTLELRYTMLHLLKKLTFECIRAILHISVLPQNSSFYLLKNIFWVQRQKELELEPKHTLIVEKECFSETIQ